MKITEQQLRTIIKEELQKTLLSELGEGRNPYDWEKKTTDRGALEYVFSQTGPKGRTYKINFLADSIDLGDNSEGEPIGAQAYILFFGYIKMGVKRLKKGFALRPTGMEYEKVPPGKDVRIMDTIIASIRDFLKTPEVKKNDHLNGEPIILAYAPSDDRRLKIYPRLIKRALKGSRLKAHEDEGFLIIIPTVPFKED